MDNQVKNTTKGPVTPTQPDNCDIDTNKVSLPKNARMPINRCNLPAAILGSLTFQQNPTDITLGSVTMIYEELFTRLELLHSEEDRSQLFLDYMDVMFSLQNLEVAGFDPKNKKHRKKADYLKMARGWSFDPDGREAAVLKGWVQSRFGLTPQFHIEPIPTPDCPAYLKYQEMRSTGIYNTNALDTQLDLLYSFTQSELKRRFQGQTHIRLYRGVNRLDQYQLLQKTGKRERIILLNNLNSFTDQRERADEFGDYILQADIPLAKIFFFHKLLPKMLKGESEYVVLGGVCQVKLVL